MKNKILMVLTNRSRYKNGFEKTGLWLSEATEFIDEVNFRYEIDYVSSKGGKVPLDPRSLEKKYVKKRDIEIMESFDFKNRALTNSLRPDQINPSEYIAIYYAGGHGVLWDYPHDYNVQVLASYIYNHGGYIATVCHGLAGILNLLDMKGGYFIKDKNVTGFTNAEEILGGKFNKLPFLTENEARRRGASFNQYLPFTEYVIKDGRLITGQNPQSARKVAQILLSNISK